MSIEVITDRPPYVTFEMLSVEDRDASEKAGHYVGKEVAFVTVTRPGSRDNSIKEADVWLADLKRRKDVPANWYPAFVTAYENWKAGEEGAVDGTPIKGWTAIGPGAQKTLLAAGIRSVEDLAQMSDGDLQNIGTGAMAFKLKAKAYLEAANGPGKMAEKLAALDTKLSQLIELTTEQAKEIERLRVFEPKEKKAF